MRSSGVLRTHADRVLAMHFKRPGSILWPLVFFYFIFLFNLPTEWRATRDGRRARALHYEFTVNTYYTRLGETKARSCNGRKLNVCVQNNRFSTVVLRCEPTSNGIWISPIFFWNNHASPKVHRNSLCSFLTGRTMQFEFNSKTHLNGIFKSERYDGS